MFRGDIKMAFSSIRSSKWRSLLTMLGIIIGVASVVVTVSLGEGVRQQIVGEITHLGSDLITVRSGKTVTRDNSGTITGVNLLSTLSASTLTEKDFETIKSDAAIRAAVPFSLITGSAQTKDQQYSRGLIVATSELAPEILNQKVEFGTFFNKDDANKQVAVIGKRVAEQLFKDNVPIGDAMKIRGQEFIVRGIFEEFESSPLTPGADYNEAIFIPYDVGKRISGGAAPIFQILARPVDVKTTSAVVKDLNSNLLANHDGLDDFTILKQDDYLAVANNVLRLFTGLIAGIAAISLLVGGIGIMNIMLVSVSERTHEIGIRKAIGATNRQILNQFLVESAVISFAGGCIGVLISIAANYLIRIFTNLQPIVSLPVMAAACTVALIVGVFFGVTPAMKAARKDPIEALRYE